MTWDLKPPASSSARDKEVELSGNELLGKHVCLLLCGSIAAYKGPDIARELRRKGAKCNIYSF